MNSVNVVLDEQLSTRPNVHNATDVTTIAQEIIKYAKSLDPQHHYNLNYHIAARPDTPNAIDIATITQVTSNYAKVLGPQYHRNLNCRIAAALNRDPDTLLTKVLRKGYNHDVVSVRTMEVDDLRIAAALNYDPSEGDSTTTRYRVTAYFIFDVHYHHGGAASDTLNAVVW